MTEHDAAPTRYTLTAQLWRHPGPAGWHFITLPIKAEVRRREELDDGDTATVTLELAN